MKGTMISDITYERARELVGGQTIVMLPIGGGSKEHGFHLPMGTDLFVIDWLARQAVERFPVLCLPTLPYAHFPAFVGWAGSVSISARHFIDYVKDILLCFVRFGVKKFVILDGGISTRAPLTILATEMNNDHGVKVAVADIAGLGSEVHDSVCEQRAGGHADESETSCMLHIRPDLVRMDKAVEEYCGAWDVEGAERNGVRKFYVPTRMETPCGSNGNSTLATGEKGRLILNAMADDVVYFLERFQQYEVGEF